MRPFQGAPVLTFGEPLVVLAAERPAPLEVGHPFRVAVGGAELNTAIGLARLGVPVAFGGAVGDDAFGRLILRHLRAEGIDVRWLEEVAQTPTGVYFKMSSGLLPDPSVLYYRSGSPLGRGAWTAEDLLQALREDAWSWLHATGITWVLGERTHSVATSLLKTAHERGIPVSFDINIRLKLAPVEKWHCVAAETAPLVTWWLTGDAEARQLFDTDEPERVLAHLRKLGFAGRGVVVKRGVDGVAVCDGDQTWTQPAWPVSRVVDTVGAGDGFNAGWIFGLLSGMCLADAGKLGTLVAAHAVVHPADHDGYPTLPEVEAIWCRKGEVSR